MLPNSRWLSGWLYDPSRRPWYRHPKRFHRGTLRSYFSLSLSLQGDMIRNRQPGYSGTKPRGAWFVRGSAMPAVCYVLPSPGKSVGAAQFVSASGVRVFRRPHAPSLPGKVAALFHVGCWRHRFSTYSYQKCFFFTHVVFIICVPVACACYSGGGHSNQSSKPTTDKNIVFLRICLVSFFILNRYRPTHCQKANK